MNPVVRFGVDAPRWILVVDESEKRVWRKSFVARFCKSCVVDGTHSFGSAGVLSLFPTTEITPTFRCNLSNDCRAVLSDTHFWLPLPLPPSWLGLRLPIESPISRGHFRLSYDGVVSGCMDVNSPQSAAGGFSVKSRLEELEEVIFLPSSLWPSSAYFQLQG